MTHKEALKQLNSTKAGKEALREALAFVLGVEYIPLKAAKHQEKEKSVFSRCQAEFCRQYREHTTLTYNFTGRDAAALKGIIEKIRNIAPGATDEATVNTFTVLIQKLPEWYRKNTFSLPVINSKFNDIAAAIKSQSNNGISKEFENKIANGLHTD